MTVEKLLLFRDKDWEMHVGVEYDFIRRWETLERNPSAPTVARIFLSSGDKKGGQTQTIPVLTADELRRFGHLCVHVADQMDAMGRAQKTVAPKKKV